MPRNASGTYTLPSGNPVVSGNIIEATWANNTLSDVGTEITGSLARNGAGGMLGALRITDGTVSVPSLSFTNETTTGFYRAGSNDVRLSIAGADAYSVTSTTFTISKNLSYTNALTGGSGVINIGSGQIYKDASGYVGFGTSSPVGRVTIKGPINATALQQLAFEYHGNTSKLFALGLQNVSGNAQIMAGSGASLIFYTNSDLDSTNERLRIDTSGNIKIAGLTSSTALALDSSNNIVSVTNTGTGNNVLATSPTLVTPVLGTPTSGTLTNCSGLPLSTGVTGTLSGANGGTGITSFGAANRVPYASSTTALTTSANFTFDGTTFTMNGSISSNNLSDAVGYKGTPVNSQSAAYTLVIADQGKTILHPASDNNARTFTIPANGTVAFPVGTTITFINMINTVTIAITTDTLYLAGAGTTGSRTLAAYGMATAVKVTSTSWIISGNGLT